MRSSTRASVRNGLPVVVLAAVLLALLSAVPAPVEAFAVPAHTAAASSAATSLQRQAFLPDSSMQVSVATLDPTTILSDLFGGIINTPVILLVPIGAASAVVFLIGFLIFSYANPQVDDDE